MIVTKKIDAWMIGCDCCDGVMVGFANTLVEGSESALFVAFNNKNDALKHAVSFGLNKVKKVEVTYSFDTEIKNEGDHDKFAEKIF
jgi:hypothetical protein